MLLALCNALFDKNLLQLVDSATHKQGIILDLILTNAPESIFNLNVDTSVCSYSDHYLLSFYLALPSTALFTTKYSSGASCDYRLADYSAIDSLLVDFVFDHYSLVDVDSAWDELSSYIVSAVHACVPISPNPLKSKHVYPNWYTPQIKHTLNKIRSLQKYLLKHPSSTKQLVLNNLRLQNQHLIEQAKADHDANLIGSFAMNSKGLFSYLQRLSKSKLIPNSFWLNDKLESDSLKIAESFNLFFHSTFTKSNYFLPSMDLLPPPPSAQLHTISLDQDEVYEVLATLNPFKSPGHDNISPKVLKFCATSLSEPMTAIFNLSLESAIFPSDWKVHRICPIPKKGDLHLISNYRPISLLPIMSKVFESLVYSKICHFIYPSLNKQQFGFLPNRSCPSQMLIFLSEILNNTEKRKSSDIVYLDFKKAFDTVSHNELLFKLWSIGITGSLWLWFKSYLNGRFHYTYFKSSQSTRLPVLSGVPQGSVLGPLLFLVFINDLPLSIAHANCYLFADDTKLMHQIETSHSQHLLQSDLDHLSVWCSLWNLSLNKRKMCCA